MHPKAGLKIQQIQLFNDIKFIYTESQQLKYLKFRWQKGTDDYSFTIVVSACWKLCSVSAYNICKAAIFKGFICL